LQRAEKADLKLLLIDGEKAAQLDEATAKLADENAIIVLNKAGLPDIQSGKLGSPMPNAKCQTLIPVSAKSGEGMQALLDMLLGEIDLRFGGSGAPPLTRARHRAALEECLQHLERLQSASEAAL